MEEQYIYIIVRECGEIQEAYKTKEDAEESIRALEKMSETTSYHIVKTYCY